MEKESTQLIEVNKGSSFSDVTVFPKSGGQTMTLMEKLGILSDAAKYDVSCSSSGVERKGDGTGIGNASAAGI